MSDGVDESAEKGRVTYRCKDCGDEFEGVEGGMGEYYACFACGGEIQKVSDNGA